MQRPTDDALVKRSKKGEAPASVETCISFVPFDANPTQEARKAVRKQAALASAAARKATIARKIAKLKEDGIEVVRGSKRRRVSEEEPRSKASKSIDGSSRRVREDGLEQTSVICVRLEDNFPEACVRACTGYTSPEQSLHEEEADEEILRGPCRCLECRLALSSSSSDQPVLSKTYQKLDTHFPSTDSLPVLSPVVSNKIDPFCQYPVEYFPIFDKLFHHMLTIFAPRGWPTLKITRAEGLEWERWMTEQGLREPAFFYVRLLFASGDLIRLGQLDPRVADWLRSLAINTINEALSDAKRSISDGLILSVGRIALTESMYGNRDAATTLHRPAQKRMIDLRGGMDALPFPPLVKKLMRWADNVMAIQSGTERILGDDVKETESNFGTKKSVDVLEKWVPQEGKALRKKITISDLVT